MLLCAETPAAEEMPPDYVTVAPLRPSTPRWKRCAARLSRQCADHFRSVTREMLRRLAEDPQAADADLLRDTYGSADFREGVEAFLAKRPPVWRGK